MNYDIISLTIEIYIAGVKNRAGFATDSVIQLVQAPPRARRSLFSSA